MKRTLIVVLLGAVALTVGCVKQEPAPPPPAADASTAAAPASTPAPADTTAPAAAPAADVKPAPATPATAAPPRASVADLPDYAGATRVAYSERTEAGKEFTRRADAEWTSPDPYARVVEYYQKAVVEKGWTITATKTKPTEIEWQLAKGTSVGKVEIKDGTPVSIKVERRDR